MASIILNDKRVVLSRRIERNIEVGTIIQCINSGTPYVEGRLPGKKKGRTNKRFYCWIVLRKGKWFIAAERLNGKNGIMIILNRRLSPGDKIKLKQSFCGTAFATVL